MLSLQERKYKSATTYLILNCAKDCSKLLMSPTGLHRIFYSLQHLQLCSIHIPALCPYLPLSQNLTLLLGQEYRLTLFLNALQNFSLIRVIYCCQQIQALVFRVIMYQCHRRLESQNICNQLWSIFLYVHNTRFKSVPRAGKLTK